MKKFLLSVYLISLLAFVGYAQNLTLSHNGAVVPNDGVVIFTGEPSTPVIEAHIGIVNNGSTALDVMCKKAVISQVSGASNTFCWDNCYPPNINVSLGPVNIAAGATNTTNFIGEYQPAGNAGQSIIRYTFFVQGNPNDSVCFQAYYHAYPLGIDGMNQLVAVSNAYPNPADNQTSFDVTGINGQPVSLVIRNVLGSAVIVIGNVSEGTYTVSTRDLSEGVYFYSLIINGKTTATHKLVVAH